VRINEKHSIPHYSNISRFAVVQSGWVLVRGIEQTLVVLFLVVPFQSENFDHRIPTAHLLWLLCTIQTRKT